MNRVLLSCSAAAVAALATAGPGAAAPLPPAITTLITRSLTACAASPACATYVKQWAIACQANVRCGTQLQRLLADNPSVRPTWDALVGTKPVDPCAAGCL
jgi:hypothetical protein